MKKTLPASASRFAVSPSSGIAAGNRVAARVVGFATVALLLSLVAFGIDRYAQYRGDLHMVTVFAVSPERSEVGEAEINAGCEAWQSTLNP